VGTSGAGKSTLLKLLTREEKPSSGKIVVGGIDYDNLKDKHIPLLRRKIGVVFQDFRLLPDRNVYENIAFAQKVVEAPNRKIKSRVLAMLSMVGLLDKYKAFPNELSGGEQQRIAIARALVNKPAILLCDEPTGNLDPANSNEIMKILNQVNKQGTTVLVVTHNMEIVQQMKKRTITMSEGKIISDQEKGGYFYED
jgi:cell division transport system ATP-binding protein